MTFPTTLDTITDGSTVIVANHIKSLQNLLIGPQFYNARGAPYLATGNGVTDDTASIQAAINAAVGGGVVYLPAGTYKISSALTLTSGVWLMGAAAPMGMIFGDALFGTIIQPTTGAYNAIQTTSGNQDRGGAIMNLGIDGFTDTTHWLVRVYGATGFTMCNVAIRQAATGANAILIGGGAGSALQCFLSNISVNCGGGFVGATGIQFGVTGTEIANANYGNNLEIQGYTTNLNLDNGGNNFDQVWVQFPAATGTGIRFNSSTGSVYGGWFESLQTGIVFTANSTNCLVSGARRSGSVTTLYTDAGTGNRLVAMDGTDYGNVTQAGNVQVNGTIQGGAISSNQGNPGLTFSDRTGGQLWQWYGTSAIARLYSGSADILKIDQSGHLFLGSGSAPVTTNKGANVTSVTFTGNDVRGSIAIVMAGALAANTRIATCTYAATWGSTPGAVLLVSETSGAGLVIVNFYSGAESATAFDLFCEQALATGTYTIKYYVIG